MTESRDRPDIPAIPYAQAPRRDTRGDFRRACLSWALAPIAGLIAIVLPVYLDPDIRWYRTETISPAIRTGIEGVSLLSVALLFALGAVLAPQRFSHGIITGLLTMVPFPIVSLIEISIYPRSHNLLPLELMAYGVLSVPGILGALTGVWLKRRARRRKGT